MTPTQPATGQREASSTEPALETARLATVIASAPGLTEQSLRTTLESLPAVQVVGTAAGCLSALQMVRERRAGLVVIDANIPFEEVQQFLLRLEREGSGTVVLVLGATTGQVYRALGAGAHAALRRDASIIELDAAVTELQRAHSRAAQGSERNPPDGP